jgi:hypothetical protein
MEKSLKKSCLGSLYLANAEAIQITCKFMVAEASERIFKLEEITFAVYYTGTTTRIRYARPRTRSRHARSTQETQSQWNQDATSRPLIT